MAFADDLTSTQVNLYDLRPGMRLKPLQSHGARLSDDEIDAEIARTLNENRQINARAALPVIAAQDELSGLAGRNARRASVQDGAASARLQSVSAAFATAPRVEDLTGKRPDFVAVFKDIVGRLAAAGPWPRRIALVLLAGVVVYLWPWMILLALVALVLLPVAFTVALGTDPVANVLIRLFHWQNARNPDRAEQIRARADRLAMRMDAALDRLPESWTVGLYMPDFSRAALLPEEGGEQPDPFDRIAAEAHHN